MKDLSSSAAPQGRAAIRTAFWAALAFYGLVAFEFFYMASPFAAYFYTVYCPGLTLLDKLPVAGWLAGFFLPHLAEDTRSVLLNQIRPLGVALALGGLIVFGVCAAQIYWAKLTRPGPVIGGLYRYVRHPQYAAFAVCSLGFLLLWPRYLTLVCFVTLLFAYYLLARIEENGCARKFGAAYTEHVRGIPMFFSWPKAASAGNAFEESCRRPWRPGLVAITYVVTLIVALAAARVVKHFSSAELYAVAADDCVDISICATDADVITGIVRLARQDVRVAAALRAVSAPEVLRDGGREKVGGPGKAINYIVPAGLYLSEIPMTEEVDSRSHVDSRPEHTGRYIVVFTWAVDVPDWVTGTRILEEARHTVGVAEVLVDWPARQVLQVRPPPTGRRYGDTPEPVF